MYHDYMRSLILIISVFLFYSCSKPTATVFEDKRLAEEDMIKFCLVGDMGKDTPFQQAIADGLEREECHRIFFLGDLVYPDGISSVNDDQFENKFLKYYEPLVEKNPKLIINLLLGNHDHKSDPSAWLDVSEKHEGFFFPNYYYFIDYGGLCFVALDTSFYYYTSKIVEAAEQATWLFQLQERIKDCDVKVALTHHPLKGRGLDPTDDWDGAEGELKAFLETYIIGKYDLHIAGHVHVLADDGKDEKTRMLISGTGGENRAGTRSGFVVLRWQPSNPKRIGYTLRYIETEPNVFSETVPQEQQVFDDDNGEYVINKSRVGSSWFSRFAKSLLDKIGL